MELVGDYLQQFPNVRMLEIYEEKSRPELLHSTPDQQDLGIFTAKLIEALPGLVALELPPEWCYYTDPRFTCIPCMNLELFRELRCMSVPQAVLCCHNDDRNGGAEGAEGLPSTLEDLYIWQADTLGMAWLEHIMVHKGMMFPSLKRVDLHLNVHRSLIGISRAGSEEVINPDHFDPRMHMGKLTALKKRLGAEEIELRVFQDGYRVAVRGMLG